MEFMYMFHANSSVYVQVTIERLRYRLFHRTKILLATQGLKQHVCSQQTRLPVGRAGQGTQDHVVMHAIAHSPCESKSWC
jgi:hypothetical protein